MTYLHSIFLTGGQAPVRPLPPRVAANVRSLQEAHPTFAHTLYDDEMLREFIKANIGRGALRAFDALLPLAYKADLGRYCLLHALGGVYADLSIHFFRPLLERPDPAALHLFRDSYNQAPWIVSNSIIGARAGEPLFQRCVEQIIQHCSSRHYGGTPLCPTGPNLFGRAVAGGVPLERLVCGDTVRINRTATHSHAYLSPGGDVIAVNIKTGAGLASLGAQVDEDYNHHYRAKNVYGELGGHLRWTARECLQRGLLNTSDRGLAPGPKRLEAGIGLRTPAVALGPGTYFTRVQFRSLAPAEAGIDLHLDMVCDAGRRTLSQTRAIRVEGRQAENWLGTRFRLDETARDVELRLRLSGAALVDLVGVWISAASAGTTTGPGSESPS